ncbi:MAG: NO-inducible flavohemoprotein [Verrucomicrobia bacterium]|nr:NO-inducible flavohemoprotein [Verrucomicrobiota bacterium]
MPPSAITSRNCRNRNASSYFPTETHVPPVLTFAAICLTASVAGITFLALKQSPSPPPSITHSLPPLQSSPPQTVSFNAHIRPILSDKCFACHGFDSTKREENLRLDTEEGAYAALESDSSQHAIVPGETKKSAVWQRIMTPDAEDVMPPPDFHKPLTQTEKELITRWIAQGAEYQQHWAFASIKKPAVPETNAKNPIDAFVRKNPESFTKGQQLALAGAICAFAANVDNLEVLGAAVERIAQKHAGLRILPEHYPIVGSNLLASICEVLSLPEDHEIITAWGEAYGFLADILIGRENQIYTGQETVENGWSGFKNFKIARKVAESDVIDSFYLAPEDGSKVPSYKPGQYLTVRVPDANSGTTMRNYSLSSAPNSDHFRISVKAEPGGAVSNLLHGKSEGDTLEVGPPCGEFFLDLTEHHERPLVLLSAGVGITPLLAILESVIAEQPQRKVIFIHGSLYGKTHAFADHVREIAAKNSNVTAHMRYSEPNEEDIAAKRFDSTGFIDAELIESLVPGRDCDYFFCGPKPFMTAIYRQLLAWGIPGGQVHFEFFGPREELEAG